MRRVARSPSYDVNAAAPIADNDIDLKVYSGKKFNAATDCDDFAAVSTFGESRGTRRERGRASHGRRTVPKGALGRRFLPKIVEFTIKKTYGPQRAVRTGNLRSSRNVCETRARARARTHSRTSVFASRATLDAASRSRRPRYATRRSFA